MPAAPASEPVTSPAGVALAGAVGNTTASAAAGTPAGPLAGSAAAPANVTAAPAAAAANQTGQQGPMKLIIDADPGIDDAMAILAAFNSPEVEVVGIKTMYGNVRTELATQNALRLV